MHQKSIRILLPDLGRGMMRMRSPSRQTEYAGIMLA